MMTTALAACSGGTQDDDAAPPRALAPASEAVPTDAPPLDPVAPGSLPERPATIRDTIMIEGMPEVTTATLLRVPPDFGLPITTYVPEGMVAELQPDDQAGTGGAGVRITAAFTPRSERDAYMHIHMYPAGTSLEEVRAAVGGFMRSREPADDPNDADAAGDSWQAIAAPAWATEAYSYRYDTLDEEYVGRITIGRHGDLYFHVLTHYPPEYGDGLGPRFSRILDAWRWEDTGRPLR